MSARPGGDPRRRRAFVALAGALGILLALVAGEVALRFGGTTSEPRRHFRPGIYQASSELGWALLPNYVGAHLEYQAEAPTRTNSDGFRGPTLEDARRSGFRVLALGDSCTFGRGVSDTETFPAQLQVALRDRGQSASVFNGGVPGYDTPQELAIWRRLGPQLEPQVVVLTWLPNDLIERSEDAIGNVQVLDGHLVHDVEGYEAWRDKIQHRGLYRSALYRCFRVQSKNLQALFGQRRHEWDVSAVTAEQLAYSTAPLATLAEEVRARGARLLLVLMPREEEVADGERSLRLYEQMRAFAEALQVEVVDMAHRWREQGPLPGRFLPRDAVHPTAAGYQELVEALLPARALSPEVQ